MNSDVIRCCVVDDEPLAARLIASYVEKTPFMTLQGVYNSAREAVKVILSGEVDVVFLDIRMPQLSGMEFARLVPKGVQVVFVTAYSDHAVEAFRVGATDYLVKPVSFDEFSSASNRVKERLLSLPADNIRADGRLIVRIGRGLEQIVTCDILYVEALKDYVRIHLVGRSPVITQTSMKSIERHLPAESFMRIHRGFIVNTYRIERIYRQKVSVGGNILPVGESYRQIVGDYISSHFPGD